MDPSGVQWNCASPRDTTAEWFAQNLATWAIGAASDSSGGWREFRHEFNLPMAPDADLRALVRIVRDPNACARAGRAYAGDDLVVPYSYRVVLVAIGDRYVGINLNAVRRSGEFMDEAVLDRDFHIISWLGT